MYEPGTLRLSNHTNAEYFLWFCLQVFRHAGPPQRVDCLPNLEISVKYVSQGSKAAMPVWESNQVSATFRSPTRRHTAELFITEPTVINTLEIQEANNVLDEDKVLSRIEI